MGLCCLESICQLELGKDFIYLSGWMVYPTIVAEELT